MKKKINKWGLVNLIFIGVSVVIDLGNIFYIFTTSKITAISMLFQSIYLISLYLFIEYLSEVRTEYKSIKKEK